MTVTLHASGGSFELADEHDFDELAALLLDGERVTTLRLRLQSGGRVVLRMSPACDWALEDDSAS